MKGSIYFHEEYFYLLHSTEMFFKSFCTKNCDDQKEYINIITWQVGKWWLIILPLKESKLNTFR